MTSTLKQTIAAVSMAVTLLALPLNGLIPNDESVAIQATGISPMDITWEDFIPMLESTIN